MSHHYSLIKCGQSGDNGQWGPFILWEFYTFYIMYFFIFFLFIEIYNHESAENNHHDQNYNL